MSRCRNPRHVGRLSSACRDGEGPDPEAGALIVLRYGWMATSASRNPASTRHAASARAHATLMAASICRVR